MKTNSFHHGRIFHIINAEFFIKIYNQKINCVFKIQCQIKIKPLNLHEDDALHFKCKLRIQWEISFSYKSLDIWASLIVHREWMHIRAHVGRSHDESWDLFYAHFLRDKRACYSEGTDRPVSNTLKIIAIALVYSV